MTLNQQQILDNLKYVLEPDLNQDIVSLKMVRNLTLNNGQLFFTIVLRTASNHNRAKLEADARTALSTVPGIEEITINFDVDIPADPRLMGKMDIGVRNAIAVASGKGGVGKSTTATNVAISLALDGASVGLLDADIYGPNIPIMMGVNERPRGRDKKIMPPSAHGVKLMSMGFLVNPNDPVIWRGPMVHNALRQFLQDVHWGGLDYLVVDLPPGTGDAILSMTQSLSLTGSIIVTTPQKVALSDVVRGVAMFNQTNVPILGVVENMSYFVAPDTGNRYDIFGHGGGADMAKEADVPFLGEVPLEPAVRQGGDEGLPIVVRNPDSAAAQAIRKVARKVAAMVSLNNIKNAPHLPDPALRII